MLLFPGLTLECPELNTELKEVTGRGSMRGVKSWGECSSLCQRRNECKFWNWLRKTRRCYTMNDAGKKERNTNFIAGEKNCTAGNK